MVSLMFVALSALFIFLSFLLKGLRTKRNPYSFPPGPKGLPFIGNFHQFDSLTPHIYLWKLSQKYGPLMTLRLGRAPILVVSSSKMAKLALKTHDLTFSSRPPLSTASKKLLYNGKDLAFAPYGSHWKETRKMCVINLFNFNRVQSFRPIRESEVSLMLEKISKSVTDNKPIDLSEAMASLTWAIICRSAFGKRFEKEGVERTRFQSLFQETQALLASFFVSDYFPAFGFVDRFTGLIQRLEKNFREFDCLYDQIIQERRDVSRSKAKPDDILDFLLEKWKDSSLEENFITLDHIKAMLADFFVGATGTTAATVVWAMTFLMKNSIAREKAKEEVRRIVGKKGFVGEDDIQQLIYLKAVIKETMRLQPPAPLLLPRQTTHNCNLEGYNIAAKTTVYVNAWAIGRDPEVWENPEEFCPDRFIGSSIDLKGQDYELIPFGTGRRICPGMLMGLANLELSLANLLYKFDWDIPAKLKEESLNMDVLPGLAVQKKNALCLMARNYI